MKLDQILAIAVFGVTLSFAGCGANDSESPKCGLKGDGSCHSCLESGCCTEMSACGAQQSCAGAFETFLTCTKTSGLSSCNFSSLTGAGAEGKALATCWDTKCYKACGGT